MTRISLIEYSSPVDLSQVNNDSTGLSDDELGKLILKSGERIRKSLKLSSDPFLINDRAVRITDIAGIVRVSPNFELEVAPKFLGLDSVNRRWREDFFFLATLSKHGRLLNNDRLKAETGEMGNLHTLVARTMTDMYWSNHRRPLRMYTNKSFTSFEIDGEVDPESIVQPSPEGFEQSGILYNRDNKYNAVILAAAKQLLSQIRDPGTITQLERMVYSLSPQRQTNGFVRNRSLPSRSARWQPLFELSMDVLNGFGLTLNSGKLMAPGYVLDTWRVWQDFLKVSMRLSFGSDRVQSQVSRILGTREKVLDGNIIQTNQSNVRPDLIINNVRSNTPYFLLDAKYKGRVEDGHVTISEQDLYESLAFSQGTGCKNILLAYPALSSDQSELGQTVIFERHKIGDVTVIGVEIETKGISLTGGLSRFSRKCASDLEEILVKWAT
ncbi:hypothetical protein BSK63_23610 [Paenibacillus odorifer]|uniref:5-methylcytosine restriction system specificity protein McrC n=1 Tax=Paenibacillus odorifer TaxID=189426 RepID=UPI00096F04D6|nr:hypothetical protein [Paenibacillus odorifer]OME28901.1 hypothetical protein BSK63_23610 [Paenibacillus odorifer]